MDDLSSLLLAAIEETERLAREATEGPWRVDYRVAAFVAAEGWAVAAGVTDIDAMHIAHNDPSSVLRRCAADRRTVERHSRYERVKLFTDVRTKPRYERYCLCCRSLWPCPDLLDRADAYGLTDHKEGEE